MNVALRAAILSPPEPGLASFSVSGLLCLGLLLVATGALGRGPGLLPFFFSLPVTDLALLHDLLNLQLALGDKLPNAALGLGKFVVTKVAGPGKGVLVFVMRDRHIT